ncbi:hypothetical protein [Hymenobacter terrigena]
MTVLVFWISTREKVLPCEVYKKNFLEKQTNLIVTDKGRAGGEILLEGLNPETHMKVTYYDEDAFYLPLKDSLEIGDTLIKARGVTFFIIRKKHSTLKIDYPCDGTRGFTLIDK